MEAIAGAQLFVTTVVAIAVAILGYRQIKVTHDLSEQVRKLTAQTDQTIQRLYRARDAAIAAQKAIIHYVNNAALYDKSGYDADFTRQATIQFPILRAEISVALTELQGITVALGDSQLSDLIKDLPSNSDFDFKVGREVIVYDGKLRDVVVKIHTRISELLMEATK